MLHRDAVHRRAVHGAVLSAHGALIRAPDVTVSPFSTRSITDSSVRGLAVRRAPPQAYSGACSAGAASCRSAARPLPPLTRLLRCTVSDTARGPLAVPMSYPLTRCLPSPRVRSDPRRVRARRRCFEATRRRGDEAARRRGGGHRRRLGLGLRKVGTEYRYGPRQALSAPAAGCLVCVECFHGSVYYVSRIHASMHSSSPAWAALS